MENTVQIIPRDWQAQIETHIGTMKNAMDFATQVPPGDEHARRWHIYEGTCEAFLDHVRTTYNSVEGFDDFLKSQTREAYRLSGASDIPDKYWPELAKGMPPTFEAQDVASHYTYVFKTQMETIAFKMNRDAQRKDAGSNGMNDFNLG